MSKPNKTIKYQIISKIIRENDTESNISGKKCPAEFLKNS